MQLYDHHSGHFHMFKNYFWIAKHSAGIKLDDIPQSSLLTAMPPTVFETALTAVFVCVCSSTPVIDVGNPESHAFCTWLTALNSRSSILACCQHVSVSQPKQGFLSE